MTSPCARAVTHHTGCACHEARRDAELAELRAEVERYGEDVDSARLAFAHEWGKFEPLRKALAVGGEQTNEDAVALAVERLDVLRAEVERLTAALDAPLVRLRPGQVGFGGWSEPFIGVTLATAVCGLLAFDLEAGEDGAWKCEDVTGGNVVSGTADSLPAAQAAAEAAVGALARPPDPGVR